MKMHHSITPELVLGTVERRMSSLDDPGFCVSCGAEAMGVEPDARNYKCESCGAMSVYGIEELLIEIGE